MASNHATSAASKVSFATVKAHGEKIGRKLASPEDYAEVKALYLASLPTATTEKGDRKESVPQEYTVLVIRGNLLAGSGTWERIGAAMGKRGRQTDASPLTPIMEFAEMRVAEIADEGEEARVIKVLSSALADDESAPSEG